MLYYAILYYPVIILYFTLFVSIKVVNGIILYTMSMYLGQVAHITPLIIVS